jgi:hypothetical protein
LRKHRFVKTAIEYLLSRKIIKDDAEIFGCGERVSIASAFDVLGW